MIRSSMCLVAAAAFLSVALAKADEESTVQIEYLLTSIAESGCVFIRNGMEHDAVAAESHLRMKYRRGKKWVTDAESFITRLATKSSFSGRPYRIRCPGEEAMATADWLNQKLSTYIETYAAG